MVVLVAFGSLVIFAATALAIVSRLPQFHDVPTFDLARDIRVIAPVQALSYIVVVAFIIAVVRGTSGGSTRALKWNWPYLRWFVFLAGGVVLAVVTEVISAHLPMPKQLPIDRFFRTSTDAWIMALFGTAVAPFVEELFFRGLLYPVLTRSLGVPASVIVTSAAFALIHENQLAHAWAPLTMIFAVGVVLTVTRARTQSLASSVLVHVGYNATLFTMLYFASDHFQHLEKITQ
jgi:membrane protease YdiL (CAAX protease family)